MSKCKALTNFTQFSDANFSAKVNLIQIKLRNNSNFQNMYPPYSELEQAVNSYNIAYTNSASRSKESISIKNTMRKNLSNFLNRTASSINAIADGNRDMLTTSGFDLTSDTPTDKTLGQVTGFSINTEGLKETMISKCSAVKNVLNYIHQYTKGNDTPDAVWISVSVSSVKYTFKGLESGSYYTFRIIAVGNDNSQNLSNPLSSYIL